MLHRRNAALLAALCPLATALAGTPISVKPGLWEMTIDHDTQGAPAMPAMPALSPETLEHMPPEMRARIEASLKQRGAGGGAGHEVYQHCITQADLDKPLFKQRDDSSCKMTPVTQTSSRMEYSFECSHEGRQQTGRISFSASDSEHVSGTTVVNAQAAGHELTVTTKISGQWVGASCGDITTRRKPGS
jgi:hypothetical protein